MTVLFYSIKWGQGKITHAVAYAKHTGAILVTNDHDNGTADIYEAALDGSRIVTLAPGQTLATALKPLGKTPIVLDFGGFVEARVTEAAKLASVCVVPLCYQSTADLTSALRTVSAIEPHCKRVIVLINNTAREHVDDLIKVLTEHLPQHTVLTVPTSRYIRRLADDGLTLHEIAVLGGIERYQLRAVLPFVDALHAVLDEHTS